MNKLVTSIALSALGAISFGQSVAYAPVKTIKDQNISLRGWGSGTISETDETAFEGTYALRVSTRNFFQGGMVGYATPLDWAGAFGDNSNLLRLTFRVADQSMTLGGGGAGGGGGRGKGGDDEGTMSAGGGGGQRAGGGAMGGGGTTQSERGLERIRVIVTTTDGKKSEAFIDVKSNAANRGWRSVSVPLKAINGFDKTNKTVKELAFSGDATATFYIGDLRVVNDTTPIQGEIRSGNMNLALGDEVELRATGTGGSSVLKYYWDFDAKDGIQEEAEGAAIRRKFRVAGTFTVTLTVTDAYGLKKPYQTKITVKVNP